MYEKLKNNKQIWIIPLILMLCIALIAGIFSQTANADTVEGRSPEPGYQSTPGTYRYFYSVLNWSVTSTTATTVTVSVSSGVRVNHSKGVNANFTGSLTSSDGHAASGTGKTRYDSPSNNSDTIVGTQSWTFARTSVDRNVTLTASVTCDKGKYDGLKGSWWGQTAVASTTVFIPAGIATITYNANGGTGGAQTYTAIIGSTQTVGYAPTRADYSFGGWKSGNTVYQPGNTFTLSGNTTFTAVWYPNVYFNINRDGPTGNTSTRAELLSSDMSLTQAGTVTKNGRNIFTTGPTYNLYDYNDSASLNIEKKGYHIEEGSEWNSKSDGTGTTYNQASNYANGTFSAGQVLYANWKANVNSIEYLPNGQGDSVTGVMPNQSITFDVKTFAISNSYIRDGYKLRGWDRDPDADPTGELDVVGDKGVISNKMLEDFENEDTVTLYAIWRPIEESQTDIHVGKIMEESGDAASTDDIYTFRIEPVEGETVENESTEGSGTPIVTEDMPMPEDTPEGQLYKDVEITGMRDNIGILRSQSVGLITFPAPGWYMYKITENAGSNPRASYDKSSYFVVCYVQYSEDTGYKVEVLYTTAWHNRNGLSNHRPNLTDISTVTDNNGVPASDIDDIPHTATEKSTFGKTAIGHQSVLVTFFNKEVREGEEIVKPPLVDLYVTKNLKGSLGDIEKQFEYTATLSGLSANTTYSVENEGAVAISGFNDELQSFTTDENGTAELAYKLSDDKGFIVSALPVNAVVNITEAASNHIPSYRVYNSQGTVKEDSTYRGNSLSTGNITMSESEEMYIALFENGRDIAVNSGIAERGIPIAIALAAVLGCLILAIIRKKPKKRAVKED
jgi:hypothetical protein